MSTSPEDITGGEPPRPGLVHVEDSLALAEFIMPGDLEQRLAHFDRGKMSPSRLLERAWIYNEYALSTPGFKGDEALFQRGRADLKRILRSGLGPRSQIRFGANMLLHYEDIFRRRASSHNVPNKARRILQQRLGALMLDFIGEDDLVRREYGQLSELVAITYLLDSELLPYIGSRREEANIIQDDNHDFYTLHPCDRNRFKKAPASVKFRQVVESTKVVGLTVGQLALDACLEVPQYAEDECWQEENYHETAVRLAADIMVCKTTGETLDQADATFAGILTAKLKAPLVEFANRPTTPDYASNAEALRSEIAAREAAAQARQQVTADKSH